ncbi:MAG: hypothetical protein COV67_05990 [Nitrospinae bacterium CG11_big_fil_rev_8_21_14_0_20_56_8]|nr:MAG: hypothetical protein COV67_05990 [Nitrospinae bacterium CG11_big_fil_rev_8_21_14_0_20_56_8]
MVETKLLWEIIFFCSLMLNIAVAVRYVPRLPFIRAALGPKYFIPYCPLEALDAIFTPGEFGPTLDAQVDFIGRATVPVAGAVKDSEAWVLAVMAKKSRRIFEFGTCTGRTTYHLARNSPADAIVTTMTLPPKGRDQYTVEAGDGKVDVDHALSESAFTRFFYSGTPVESKIKQLFADSKQFDEAPYLNSCDLIFVDGSHAYSYVKSDSKKALQMIKPGGVILWHDYHYNPKAVPGVFQALNELSMTYPMKLVSGTSLVMYRKIK